MIKKNKLIVRLFGGLGNQLFIYAAAKRLALKNNADLIIDNVSGFEKDFKYNRTCQLHHFNIELNTATKNQRFEPFSKYRRYLIRKLNQILPFNNRFYIFQNSNTFEYRLLNYKIFRNTYLEGYWQSELYFHDIMNELKHDLTFIEPNDIVNNNLANKIKSEKRNTVAIHYRFFENPNSNIDSNISYDYYKKALDIINSLIQDLHFYIFSDRPNEAIKILNLPEKMYTLVSHNINDDMAFADMWLMSQCNHFIIANSTFSWWGAWLSNFTNKIVIAPGYIIDNPVGSWNFKNQIPDNWIKIS